jgi:hypothetical protein
MATTGSLKAAGLASRADLPVESARPTDLPAGGTNMPYIERRRNQRSSSSFCLSRSLRIQPRSGEGSGHWSPDVAQIFQVPNAARGDGQFVSRRSIRTSPGLHSGQLRAGVALTRG